MTDIEIANGVQPNHIRKIAEKLGLTEDQIEQYGKDKAKVSLEVIDEEKVKKSNLILVTAINPTPSGEGKTTASIGLADGLNAIGKKTTVVLREPSLGPVFGIKGGAAGGGHSQVIPMESINLNFTGDFSAIEKANNLLAALIDNNIQSKTESLGIDPRTVLWKRCMDMNDRNLRTIITGLGGKTGGIPAETGFNITAASEIMAILCLSKDLNDLKTNLGNIYVGDTFDRKPVFARDLKAQEAMTILLKEAIKPNLVQTLEHNPAFIHGGPFANIAQGTNSLIATKTAMSLSDYVVTEAGFGADLGAEKFLDIKCRKGKIAPKAIVIVATVRALKYHGGASLQDLEKEDLKALEAGIPNLTKHIENMHKFDVPVVVALNRFTSDTDKEVALLSEICNNIGAEFAVSNGWAQGGQGCIDFAHTVVKAVESNHNELSLLYSKELSIKSKIETICKEIYGADGVTYDAKANRLIKRFTELGFEKLPICMAKTQKSLSDNEKLIGRPENFTINIRDVEIASGAGFIIPITGSILRMPGLPKHPASENMKIDGKGNIEGLS